jgi:predicted DNA-binding transcriptional regulator AlpA
MAQVAKVFKEKRDAKLAKSVSSELGICLASFYKYARGEDLPRPEVLRAAKERWGVEWDLIDVTQIMEKKTVASPEQYVLSFLQEVRNENVQITKIGPKVNAFFR